MGGEDEDMDKDTANEEDSTWYGLVTNVWSPEEVEKLGREERQDSRTEK